MFDFDRFVAAVRRAQQEPAAASAQGAEGMVLIVETRGRAEHAGLEERLRQALPVAFELAPLFAGSAQLELAGERDLANFFTVKIAGVPFDAVVENPFDLAHHLRQRAELRTVDPSLPLPFAGAEQAAQAEDSGPWSSSSGGSGGGGGGTKPADRGWPLRNMRFPGAWGLQPPAGGRQHGEGVLIGQPDTGYCDHIDLQPPALSPHLGFNFIENRPDPKDAFTTGIGTNPGHGGSVASVIIGRGTLVAPPPPGSGTAGPGIIAGAAPKATLVPIRCVTGVALIYGEKLAAGIYHGIVRGCRVLSLSLGGLYISAVQAVIDEALKRDMIVVCAAGNHVGYVVYPAASGKVVAVAGSTQNNQPWSGSCNGAVIDVSAPAELVYACWRDKESDPRDAIGAGSGTSYATALTAGLAAAWLAFQGPRAGQFKRPGETLCATFKRLLRTSAHRPAPWNPNFGAGVASAHDLLQMQPGALTAELPAPPAAAAAGGSDLAAALLATLEAAAGADLDTAAGVNAGAIAPGSSVQFELAQGFGVSPDQLQPLLDTYGVELAYLATRARLRAEAGGPPVAAGGASGAREGRRSLLDTVRDEGSAALRAASAQLVS